MAVSSEIKTLEQMKEFFGDKHDGYAIAEYSDQLGDRCKTIKDVLLEAINHAEENWESEYNEYVKTVDDFPVEIWSFYDIEISRIFPSGNCVINEMIENYYDRLLTDSNCPLEDVSEEQVKKLNEMLEKTINKWVKESKIHFDYYEGHSVAYMNIRTVKNILSQVESEETNC